MIYSFIYLLLAIDDFYSVSLWQFLTSDMKLMTMGLAHDGPKTPWVYRKQDTQNEKLRPGVGFEPTTPIVRLDHSHTWATALPTELSWILSLSWSQFDILTSCHLSEILPLKVITINSQGLLFLCQVFEH